MNNEFTQWLRIEWQRELDDINLISGGGCVLRVLAVPLADRPGYREEWRP